MDSTNPSNPTRSAKATRPLAATPNNPGWTRWISKEDRAHIEEIERSVKDGYLPASAALSAVNTTRIASEAEFRATGVARFLQGIRNLGVLIPVMVTWISFALASSAYNASLAVSSPQSQDGSASQLFSLPLLEQWEQGFIVPSAQVGPVSVPLIIFGQRWFTFSHLAIVDAALIFGLVVITFVAQLIEAEGLHRARDAMRQVEIKLFAIAAVGTGGVDSGQTIETRTLRAFERIEQVVGNLHGAVGEFSAAMVNVPQTTLEVVTEHLLEFEQKSFSAQDAVNEQVQRFVDKTTDIITDVRASVSALTNHWKTVSNLESEIGRNATAAAQAATEAGQFGTMLSQSIDNLRTEQGAVEARLRSLASSYERSIERLEAVGSHFDQTAELQRQLIAVQEITTNQLAALRQSGEALNRMLKQIAEYEGRKITDPSDGGGFFGFFKRRRGR